VLASLPVHGLHQGPVQDDAAGRGHQQPGPGRHQRRHAGGEAERHHHRRQHGRLAVRQVEHTPQAVDQGHAHAQQPELEAKDDPVEDDGPHATPR
jgi:hypothetical protein